MKVTTFTTTNSPKNLAFLFLPLSGKTNFSLRFSVWNNSQVTANDVGCLFSFPPNLDCAADPPWEDATNFSMGMIRFEAGPTMTIRPVSKLFSIPFILAGNGSETTELHLKFDPKNGLFLVSILIRADGFPADEVQFLLWPLVVPQNVPPHKPFILVKPNPRNKNRNSGKFSPFRLGKTKPFPDSRLSWRAFIFWIGFSLLIGFICGGFIIAGFF